MNELTLNPVTAPNQWRSLMGLLDGLVSNLPSEPQNRTGAEFPWLRPILGAPSNAPSDQRSLGPAPQDPALLGRLTAGATNLTTGGNPIAGLLNSLSGLATGERTDRAGIELAQQQAIVNALMNAGLDLPTARAAAIHPEYLRALIVAHYGARRGEAVASRRAGTDRKETGPAGDIGGSVAPHTAPTTEVGKPGP